MQDDVTVTQVDIDTFAAIFEFPAGFLDVDGDDKRVVEIIARHRIAAEAKREAEIMAWLREQPKLVSISPCHVRSNSPDMIADAIERGEVPHG